jgi:hypothetical protein
MCGYKRDKISGQCGTLSDLQTSCSAVRLAKSLGRLTQVVMILTYILKMHTLNFGSDTDYTD